MSNVLHNSVRLECTAQRAFEMFTDNELLESWFPPLADVEPWVGGKYELFWNPDDKENDSTIGCKVTAIAPDKLLAFDWKGPVMFKDFMNNADPLTHVAVVFADCGEGSEACSEVHVIHSGWRSSPEWQEAKQFFDRAWKEELEALRRVVAAR